MPGPRSRTSMISACGLEAPSNAKVTSPPYAYSNALRAISETALAMRVWSSMEKPKPAAIARALRRAATTSSSASSRMRSMGVVMPEMYSLVCLDDYHGGVVAASREIAVQHGGDHHGRLQMQAGIRRQIPARADAVRMQDEQRVARPRHFEFLRVAHRMTDD